MSSLKLFFLGPPRLEQDGQILTMDTRKAIAMLAYLALTGERQSRDHLAALLWPEFDHKRAKAALRRTLSTLKSIVGVAPLIISRDALGLALDSIWCDVIRFRVCLAADDLETAVSLYRDDFMSGFSLRDSLPFDDWQLLQVENLRREMNAALESLSQRQQTAGDFGQAVETARHWLQRDPLREEAHRQLMHCLALSGQRNTALRQYRQLVRLLDEELGVPPLPETTALYEAIQTNQVTAVTSETRFLSPAPGQSLSLVPPPLIGRAAELARMQQVMDQVGPDGRWLALVGEAGIGKTRLADAFATIARTQHRVVLAARGYAGESHLAYAPLIQLLQAGLNRKDAAARLATAPPTALAEAARLLPDLAVGEPLTPSMPDAPGAQNRFLDGVNQVLAALLAGDAPGIIWLDDAHWLDAATLEWLRFTLHRWVQRPSLLLLCWRPEELPAAHPLPQTMAGMSRHNVGERLPLTRFSPDQVAQLLTAYPQLPLDLAARLYRETEGLPYFVVEFLNRLLSEPEATAVSWDLPPTVRDLLLARLASLHEVEQQLLQTGAVIGRAFDDALVQRASGRGPEEAVTALEGLVRRGLLVEQTAVYDFSHSKLRALVYDECSLARRRLLHRRVAEALAQPSRRRSQTTAVIAEIATHYRQAGRDAEAADYFVQAGNEARALFAHREALAYFQAALALGHPEAARWHEACGDLHVRLGDYAAAQQSYETAAAQLPAAETGLIEQKLGQVYTRQGEWARADGQFERALTYLAEPDARAWLYIDWSRNAYYQKDVARATQLARQAERLAEGPPIQAQIQNILGILAREQGELDEAIVHCQAGLAFAQTHNLPDVQIATLNNLALVETAVGETASARTHLQTALSLCQRYGDRHWQAALHNNLADLYHKMGDEAAAMAELKTAVALYAEIGGQPGQWQPEIWKLTDW